MINSTSRDKHYDVIFDCDVTMPRQAQAIFNVKSYFHKHYLLSNSAYIKEPTDLPSLNEVI